MSAGCPSSTSARSSRAIDEAVVYADRFLTVPVPRRFRTVVTSAAGYPLDQTYYQTVKGMVTPLDIVDDDATLIVASDCSEGLGSDAFRASQRRLIDQGADAFLASLLEKRFADIDEWESEMQTKAQRAARVRMMSRLNDVDRELTGVEPIDSVEEAVRESVEGQRRQRRGRDTGGALCRAALSRAWNVTAGGSFWTTT